MEKVSGKNKSIIQFKILLLFWILFCNFMILIFHIKCSWVILISNIMLFTMSGNIEKNLISIEFGGCIGLIMAFFSIQVINNLSGKIGMIPNIMVVLIIALAVIILLNDDFPVIFNNASFLYFTCAFIIPEKISSNF